LIDPDVCSLVIGRFLEAGSAVDYASNKIPQSYPRGLDCEVFTRAALESAWSEADQPYERAHVTPYVYQHPDRFRLLSVTDAVDRSWWRWTVDTPEDLELVRVLYQRLGNSDAFTWRDVVALIEDDPSLLEINRHVEQKALILG
jgi:spore coat polysaccharide biosynthesis protein SpsF